MLIRIMPALTDGKIHLPGGWQVGVPEIRVDRDTQVMVRDLGIDMGEFNVAMQKIFEKGMVKSVSRFVTYWATEYEKMYPELWDSESGELAGYDAEDIVRYWLPIGRGGGKRSVEIRYQLGEYAREGRRK